MIYDDFIQIGNTGLWKDTDTYFNSHTGNKKLKLFRAKSPEILINMINSDDEVLNHIIDIKYKFPRQSIRLPCYAIVYYTSDIH